MAIKFIRSIKLMWDKLISDWRMLFDDFDDVEMTEEYVIEKPHINIGS